MTETTSIKLTGWISEIKDGAGYRGSPRTFITLRDVKDELGNRPWFIIQGTEDRKTCIEVVKEMGVWADGLKVGHVIEFEADDVNSCNRPRNVGIIGVKPLSEIVEVMLSKVELAEGVEGKPEKESEAA